jgi:hypothetical protein
MDEAEGENINDMNASASADELELVHDSDAKSIVSCALDGSSDELFQKFVKSAGKEPERGVAAGVAALAKIQNDQLEAGDSREAPAPMRASSSQDDKIGQPHLDAANDASARERIGLAICSDTVAHEARATGAEENSSKPNC